MSKQIELPTDDDCPVDIRQDIQKTFIRQSEQWAVEQQRQRDMERAALLSEDEVEQFNTAVETIADKLGISGELATIDALLRARNTRVARILTAAYSEDGR